MSRSYRARVIDAIHEARRSIAMEETHGDMEGEAWLRDYALGELRNLIDALAQHSVYQIVAPTVDTEVGKD